MPTSGTMRRARTKVTSARSVNALNGEIFSRASYNPSALNETIHIVHVSGRHLSDLQDLPRRRLPPLRLRQLAVARLELFLCLRFALQRFSLALHCLRQTLLEVRDLRAFALGRLR